MNNPNLGSDVHFDSFTLKNRMAAWISTCLFGTVTYTVRRGLLKGMKRKGGLAWAPAIFSRDSLDAEEQFLCGLNLAGATVYDVGACQGLVTVFLAKRAKTVICFEPNSRNYSRILENLELNGIHNVEVRKAGVGSRRDTRRMIESQLMPGLSSIDANIGETLVNVRMGTVVEEILIIALDEEISKINLPAPDFIKIDTEGWEIEVLRGARDTLARHRPTLFLEMHGATMSEKSQKVREIVAFLWELNYRQISHVETGTAITLENSDVAMEGHLYAR
jgi:FkbM family methyltransferase